MVCLVIAGCPAPENHAWGVFVGIGVSGPLYVSNEEDNAKGEFWFGRSKDQMRSLRLKEEGDCLTVKSDKGVLAYQVSLSELLDPATGQPLASLPTDRAGVIQALRLSIAYTIGDVFSLAQYFSKEERPYPDNLFGDIKYSVPVHGFPMSDRYTTVIEFRGGRPARTITLDRQSGTLKWAGTSSYRPSYWSAWTEDQAIALAKQYFPSALVEGDIRMEPFRLEGRVGGLGAHNGSILFMWRLKDRAAPFFVGTDGKAYRLTAGQCYDAASGAAKEVGPWRVEVLASRSQDVSFPCTVPEESQAASLVDQLPVSETANVKDLPWGASMAAITAARSDLRPPLAGLLYHRTGRAGLLNPILQSFDLSTTPMRVLEGPSDYVLVGEQGLKGYIRVLSEVEYLACETIFRKRFGAGLADPAVLGPSATPSWQVGPTTLALVRAEEGSVKGLLLLEATGLKRRGN